MACRDQLVESIRPAGLFSIRCFRLSTNPCMLLFFFFFLAFLSVYLLTHKSSNRRLSPKEAALQLDFASNVSLLLSKRQLFQRTVPQKKKKKNLDM